MGDDKEPQPKAAVPQAQQVVQAQAQAVEHDVVAAPGAFSKKASPKIPEWYTVGWRQACSIDKPPLPEGEEKDKSILDVFIGEQFYGEWYHNAGIIIFVCHPPYTFLFCV